MIGTHNFFSAILPAHGALTSTSSPVFTWGRRRYIALFAQRFQQIILQTTTTLANLAHGHKELLSLRNHMTTFLAASHSGARISHGAYFEEPNQTLAILAMSCTSRPHRGPGFPLPHGR